MAGSTNDSDGARPAIADIVAKALRQFVELNGQTPDRVSGLRRADDGWSILVDVVDLERVPATTSVLSTYRVDVDGAGTLIGYERIRRFTRASVDNR
jgi:hypothetical protein